MVGAGVGVGPSGAGGQTVEGSHEYPPVGQFVPLPTPISRNAQLGLLVVSARQTAGLSESLVMVQQSPVASTCPQQHSSAVPTGPVMAAEAEMMAAEKSRRVEGRIFIMLRISCSDKLFIGSSQTVPAGPLLWLDCVMLCAGQGLQEKQDFKIQKIRWQGSYYAHVG